MYLQDSSSTVDNDGKSMEKDRDHISFFCFHPSCSSCSASANERERGRERKTSAMSSFLPCAHRMQISCIYVDERGERTFAFILLISSKRISSSPSSSSPSSSSHRRWRFLLDVGRFWHHSLLRVREKKKVNRRTRKRTSRCDWHRCSKDYLIVVVNYEFVRCVAIVIVSRVARRRVCACFTTHQWRSLTPSKRVEGERQKEDD